MVEEDVAEVAGAEVEVGGAELAEVALVADATVVAIAAARSAAAATTSAHQQVQQAA